MLDGHTLDLQAVPILPCVMCVSAFLALFHNIEGVLNENSQVKIHGSAAELLPRSVAPQHLEHAHLRSRDAPEMYSTRDLAARVSPTCAPATARSARACGSRVAGPPPPPARAAPRARRRSPIGSKERAPRQRDGRRHLAASRRRHPIAARPADLDVPKATPRRLGARVGQVATVFAHVPRRVHMCMCLDPIIVFSAAGDPHACA